MLPKTSITAQAALRVSALLVAAALCVVAPASAQQVTAAVGAGAKSAEAMFGGRDCAVPARVARIAGSLPRASKRLHDGGRLRIVAIGSSSTEGIGATRRELAYPAQLERELARRFPASAISVINKGVGGELARDMAARMDRDAIAHKPDLVIWQTGTNDAERGIAAEAFADTMRDGLGRLRAAGIDVLIVDPQFTPRVVARGGYPAYMELIARLAEENGAALFRRQAVMRQWVDGGAFSFETMLWSDRFHMNDRSYRCLATVLADAIETLVLQ